MIDSRLRTALGVSLALHGLIILSVHVAPPAHESGAAPLVARLLPPSVRPAPPGSVAAKVPTHTMARDSRSAPRALALSQRPESLLNGDTAASASIRPAGTRDDNRDTALAAERAQPGNSAGVTGLAAAMDSTPGRAVLSSAESAPVTTGTTGATGATRDNATDAEAVRAYRLLVASKARGFKRYPADALAAGWAGTAEVRIRVAPGGRPQDINLERSSGFATLDRAALAMIEAGMVRASVPEPLLGRAFAVTLPVVFEPELR